MEDDNGLELSLGLSFGGSSAKPKVKNDGSSDIRTEEADRSGKIVDDFKNFLNGSSQIPDPNTGNQRSNSERPQENFFNDLSKEKEEDASVQINGRGIWITKDTKPVEIEGNKLLEVGKRKMPFDDLNHQKKQEREIRRADSQDRTRASHISVTEDGSTAENEDVADSEVENSSSRPISIHDDGSKRFTGVGGPSEVCGAADPKVAEKNAAHKRFSNSLGNEFKTGNVNYGPSFSVQSVNVLNMPYPVSVKESGSVGTSTTTAHSIPGIMQVMPASNDRSGIQPLRNGNLPATFGYSPIQLPMFDKDNSWGLISHHQQFQYAGRGPTSSVSMQVIQNRLSEGKQHNGRPAEQAKVDVKQHNTEEGSSSLTEDAKGSSNNLRAKDLSEKSNSESLSLDFSAIKPGIAADVKFGGCGSYPNLPWVSATGSGPNARTISGVTYRYSPNQIRIVCACHGSHMSPEDFIRHASEENVSAEGGVV